MHFDSCTAFLILGGAAVLHVSTVGVFLAHGYFANYAIYERQNFLNLSMMRHDVYACVMACQGFFFFSQFSCCFNKCNLLREIKIKAF